MIPKTLQQVTKYIIKLLYSIYMCVIKQNHLQVLPPPLPKTKKKSNNGVFDNGTFNLKHISQDKGKLNSFP